MADILPSSPDLGGDPDPDDPRVVGVDAEDADDVLSALSSDTAREMLSTLHEEPGAASDLAERVDTTLQNAQYHLERMQDAGLIEVAGTAYSEKGREMDVYAPSDRALVVVAGREEDTEGLAGALKSLLGALLPLGLGAILIEIALDGPFAPDFFGMAAGGGSGAATVSQSADTAAEATATEAGTPIEAAAATKSTEIAAETTTAAEPGLLETLASSPGVLFFAGGVVALVVGVAVVSYRRSS
ncbi:MAG: ArsR/SmtB family transcription factor [Halobaculum sp.]